MPNNRQNETQINPNINQDKKSSNLNRNKSQIECEENGYTQEEFKQHSQKVVKTKDEVINVEVKNSEGEDLGKICEVMLEKVSGKAVYAVLESGTFLGMGGKLFAIPWNALHYDVDEECFILEVDKEELSNAPGFDKNNWPDMADRRFGATVDAYYRSSNSTAE